ncbi:hypothetical protein [Nocardia gipuzkoensis]|uniref:hypothetical protein n=1 Tax=Nocardia gipuzkoensis TaxID=2749991 RepID=UPI0015EFB281|nr:hypothetical protein [Nocardia gipuzkoensis]
MPASTLADPPCEECSCPVRSDDLITTADGHQMQGPKIGIGNVTVAKLLQVALGELVLSLPMLLAGSIATIVGGAEWNSLLGCLVLCLVLAEFNWVVRPMPEPTMPDRAEGQAHP